MWQEKSEDDDILETLAQVPWKLKWSKFSTGPTVLGGGFKYFYVHPYLGKIPILTNMFSNGLKPPTRVVFVSFKN